MNNQKQQESKTKFDPNRRKFFGNLKAIGKVAIYGTIIGSAIGGSAYGILEAIKYFDQKSKPKNIIEGWLGEDKTTDDRDYIEPNEQGIYTIIVAKYKYWKEDRRPGPYDMFYLTFNKEKEYEYEPTKNYKTGEQIAKILCPRDRIKIEHTGNIEEEPWYGTKNVYTLKKILEIEKNPP